MSNISNLSVDCIRSLYLEYVGNCYNIVYFAKYYNLSRKEVELIIKQGEKIQAAYHDFFVMLEDLEQQKKLQEEFK